jgi:hypothetical protein
MLVGSASIDFFQERWKKEGGSEGTPGYLDQTNDHDKKHPDDISPAKQLCSDLNNRTSGLKEFT